jgi:hypothetical protein
VTIPFCFRRFAVGRVGYREQTEQLGDEERRLFGEHGFENREVEVPEMEAAFGWRISPCSLCSEGEICITTFTLCGDARRSSEAPPASA